MARLLATWYRHVVAKVVKMLDDGWPVINGCCSETRNTVPPSPLPVSRPPPSAMFSA
jgi:hypothetical protein